MWIECDESECDRCLGEGEYWECEVTGECGEWGCGPFPCLVHEKWVD